MHFKTLAAFVLFPLAACAIAFVSLYPKMPSLPLPWDFADKIEHLAAYMILSGLAMVFFCQLVKRPIAAAAAAAAVCILWGGVIELIQPAFGRTADVFDFLVNLAGILAICTLILAVNRFRAARQS